MEINVKIVFFSYDREISLTASHFYEAQHVKNTIKYKFTNYINIRIHELCSLVCDLTRPSRYMNGQFHS